MNVIAKISCYFEHSVVTLKLRKEYLNTVTYNTSVLLRIKKLHSLIYRTLLYVNIYGSYKLSKNSPVFFGPPCIHVCHVVFEYLMFLVVHEERQVVEMLDQVLSNLGFRIVSYHSFAIWLKSFIIISIESLVYNDV